MEKCIVCGKRCDDKNIKKGGKTFCCPAHLKQFDDPSKPNKNANVCEFC